MIFGVSAVAVVLVALGLVALTRLKNSFFYPKPLALPAIVGDSFPILAQRLEGILRTNAPEALAALNPGLSEEKISQLEATANLKLPNDLRLLYQWHNGQTANSSALILPGHRFVPLDQAIAERRLLEREEAKSTSAQKASTSLFAGHRKGWLTVFDDGAGDGYFFDPHRSTEPGHFFYNMSEDRYYVFFPSARNFLAGLIDCYSQKAIRPNNTDGQLEEDFQKSQQIWERYGSSSEDK